MLSCGIVEEERRRENDVRTPPSKRKDPYDLLCEARHEEVKATVAVPQSNLGVFFCGTSVGARGFDPSRNDY